MRRHALLILALSIAAPVVAQPQASKYTLPLSEGGGGAVVDPLTVLGPESVCADNQVPRWDGASATKLQCSVLTVADTTGNISAPGALTISTAGSNGGITLDPHGAGQVSIPDGAFFSLGIAGLSNRGSVNWLVVNRGTSGGTSVGNIAANDFAITDQTALAGSQTRAALGTDWATVPGLQLSSRYGISFTSVENSVTSGHDLYLVRDLAAGTLAQRNGAAQQSVRIYNTADAFPTMTNYERLTLTGTAGSSVDIKAETAGTGADNLSIRLVPAGTSGVMGVTEVEANTAGSGAPNVLLAAESWKLLTNEGAAAENYHTLPSAAVGLRFTFVVQDSDGLRIVAAAGDTIRAGTVAASSDGGYIRSATQGAAITLVAINATEWIATSIIGTWTVDS